MAVTNRKPALWLLLSLILTGTFAYALADWPATAFRVFPREPTPGEVVRNLSEASIFDQLVDWFAEDEFVASPASLHASGWLGEVAGYYRRAGHPAPALPAFSRHGGKGKYHTYIFPFAGSSTRGALASDGGTYELVCKPGNKLPWLAINYDLALGRLPKNKYWTISHELMHALMFGDRIFAHCNRDSFEVFEGMPDGAAFIQTNRKFPGYSGGVDISGSAVGLRSYRRPLLVFTDARGKDKSRLEQVTGYGTSSFWSFIAERFGGLPVFPHMLDEVIVKGASREQVYQWLDERLQTLPGLSPPSPQEGEAAQKKPPGLYEVYPAFVTEFASYGGARYQGFYGQVYKTWDQARNAWLRRAFGGCALVELNPQWKTRTVTLDIAENAAQCVRLRYSGFEGNVEAKLEVLHDRLPLLDQLHLGWAWKRGPAQTGNCFRERKKLNSKWPPCILKAFSQTGPRPGHYARTWPLESMDFGTESEAIAERIYVMSNVAVKPWKTRPANGLVVRVAVSDSVVNEEPAEPVSQLAVARKKPPRNPMAKRGREELYGLETAPPLPGGDAVKGLTIQKYAPGRSEGGKAHKVGGYAVQFRQLEYGKTGPVHGMVTLQAADPRVRGGVVHSAACGDQGQSPIGTVLQSDEQALHIKLEADLCRVAPDSLRQCESQGCPVVDHMTADLHIAFGWRQFAGTAATDIRTPGIQRYINTMPDSLGEAMRFGADTALPDSDDPGVAGPGDAGGEGGVGGGAKRDCACTCEEMRDSEGRMRELKARRDSGEEVSPRTLSALSQCHSPCMRQYMVCQLEEDKERKAREVAAERTEAELIAAGCDCSCAGIKALEQQSLLLVEKMQRDPEAAMGELKVVTECYSVCQAATIACYSER